ncbi:MAG TPA: hypothetical protein IAB70_05445 [Candidatus Merdicola faecigallinarum]|uniref:Uncharacterized protein n=1 Tax=Candidatus Merdicola faecigallinarum TaxID=2840862 RepID=A0A9D1S9M4_9FIRM|nr:hypothetical protein [Candidatus Merdicola faecigallinarum]
MAGYVIHLAVGEKYLKFYPNEIKNYDDFIQGIIYPDSVADKSLTHYGPKSSEVNLRDFFNDRDINNDFDKGYFLHLVTDYLFYNKFLKTFSKKYIYDDYDILNEALEKEFQVKIPSKVKDEVFYKTGKTKILDLKETIEFITETAKSNLKEIKTAVLNGDKNWLEIRPLAKIKTID